MRRFVVAGIVTVAMAGSIVDGHAGAITYGVPDGEGHPEVGALLATQAYSDGTWSACTGTLIASNVFLTAAHCDLGTSRVEVTFASTFDRATSATFWGEWHADPNYTQSQNDPHDLAVVVLDSAPGLNPARLPTAGSLANLPQNQAFTSVGYGAQSVTNDPGGQTFHYADVRYVGSGTLNATNPAWLRLSQNPATGDAGTCYGDSGGPNFLGAGGSETNIVAAATVTGDVPCRATNVDYRLDTESARNFLGQYVTLP